MPKSSKVSSRNLDCFSKLSLNSVSDTLLSGSFKKDNDGNRYSNNFALELSCKGKFVCVSSIKFSSSTLTKPSVSKLSMFRSSMLDEREVRIVFKK